MDAFSMSFLDNNVLSPWVTLQNQGSCTSDIHVSSHTIVPSSDDNILPDCLTTLMMGNALYINGFDQRIQDPPLELGADGSDGREGCELSSAIHQLKTSSTMQDPDYLSTLSCTDSHHADQMMFFSARELLSPYQYTQAHNNQTTATPQVLKNSAAASFVEAPYSGLFHGASVCTPPFPNATADDSPCTSSHGLNQPQVGVMGQNAASSSCDMQIKGSNNAISHNSSTSDLLLGKKRRTGPKLDTTKNATGSSNLLNKEVHHADTKIESSTNNSNTDDSDISKPSTVCKGTPEVPKLDYIHVRARRGQATDSHSLAERVRREKISEKMRYLQDLIPGCSKITGKAVMLDEIINYVQSLQRQIEFLSMKLASVNPRNMDTLFGSKVHQAINFPSQPALFHAKNDLGYCHRGQYALQVGSTVGPPHIAYEQTFTQEPTSWRPLSTTVPPTNVFAGRNTDSQVPSFPLFKPSMKTFSSPFETAFAEFRFWGMISTCREMR